MIPEGVVRELQSRWFPNLTDAGLDRLIRLLDTDSPLLIHGCFTRATPMGCLATHAAWHHPRTELEPHGRQAQRSNCGLHGVPLGRELAERRRDEHPQPLVGGEDGRRGVGHVRSLTSLGSASKSMFWRGSVRGRGVAVSVDGRASAPSRTSASIVHAGGLAVEPAAR